jgi:hypothetical protein
VAPALVAFSGATRQVAQRILDENEDLVLLGKVSVRRKRPENVRDPNRNVTFEILETEKGTLLWNRYFSKRAPALHGTHSPGRLILTWPATSDGAREEVANNASLRGKVDLKSATVGDYLLEVLDSSNGSLISGFILRTGKGAFRLESADSVGDWLILADNENRVLLYSLSTGEVKAHYFGVAPAFSSNGRLLHL